MNKLLSLLGLDARIRRVKIAAGESAMAIEDRTQLLRMAWDDEKDRLQRMLLLIIAVLGLTTVAVALLSVAVVVHFWDTPHRATAAWSVAGVWIALWAVSLIGLLSTLRGASGAFAPSRQEFERDWAWVQDRLGIGNQGQPEGTPRPTRPATREELLARIARQRQRIAVLQAASADAATAQAAPPPPDETPSETALRLLRAHPVAAGVAAAAVVAVVKPRRLLRWAAFVAPVLWRMR
ncbi:phage holin family protein [Variovorax boronicumulans]|uniref:phage holin family protein n=1 Tax=Variovorax boronicumulans TaxID=436515 RepID=UPI001C56DC7B